MLRVCRLSIQSCRGKLLIDHRSSAQHACRAITLSSPLVYALSMVTNCSLVLILSPMQQSTFIQAPALKLKSGKVFRMPSLQMVTGGRRSAR